MNKRVGRFVVSTYPDTDSTTIEVDSASGEPADVTMNLSPADLFDLKFAASVAMMEQGKRTQ